MKAKQLTTSGSEKTYALIFEQGDEAMAGLEQFAIEHALHASQISAIGAFQEATLGFFDWEKKDYTRIEIHEQVEVLSLLGDISLHEGKPKVHVHVVLGKRDGAAVGGHLLQAKVRPTLEVILTESPRHLTRQHDPASGLALISP